jgi:hypothetical protein
VADAEHGGCRIVGWERQHMTDCTRHLHIKVIGRASLVLIITKLHSDLFSLFKSVFRLGCTRFGSPGIFG